MGFPPPVPRSYVLFSLLEWLCDSVRLKQPFDSPIARYTRVARTTDTDMIIRQIKSYPGPGPRLLWPQVALDMMDRICSVALRPAGMSMAMFSCRVWHVEQYSTAASGTFSLSILAHGQIDFVRNAQGNGDGIELSHSGFDRGGFECIRPRN